MMVDIFSSFDPATNSIFNTSSPLFWLLNISTLLIVHPIFWLSPSRGNWILTSFTSIMNEQVSRTLYAHMKGSTSILTALFILIILLNFSGILPYVFSTSSHLLFSLTLGLPMWIGIILSGVMKSPSSAAASLLPGGAPAWLNPFLVLVETLSILVRPITLSFRLAANMTAGHVIISLVGSYLTSAAFMSGPTSLLSLTLVQTGYMMFEFGVCIIQGYIFCLLLSLYSDDHPDH